jgi:hypothetical protein
MSRSITLKQLKKAGACPHVRQLFVTIFGKDGRMRVTDATAHVFAQSQFSANWAAGRLLSEKQRREYSDRVRVYLGAGAQDTVNAALATVRNVRGGQQPGCWGGFYIVANKVQEAYEARLRLAQARAFADAYNSPRK